LTDAAASPEVTASWDDIVPTLVLVGSLDLEPVQQAARSVAEGIAGARLVNSPDTAHLPSMERPDDILALLRDWLALSEPPRH
jgi:pimeloyl-ACP methyl ester carboxylesterase